MLWSPSTEEEATLRADWEALAHLIREGQVELITGHLGLALQLRPKAANAQARRWGVGEDGARIRTLPRAFYLRAAFTTQILERAYVLPR